MLNKPLDIIKLVVKKGDYSFLALTLSMFLLPLSINLSTFTLIASIVLKIIQSIYHKELKYGSKALKHSVIIGFVFLVYIIINSIIQTNLRHTFVFFEKQFSHFTLLFIIPFIMGNKKENKLPFYALLIGSLVAIIEVFALSVINKIPFDKYAFLRFLDIHHTYLSIYLLTLVNLMLIKLLSKNKLKINTKLFILIIISLLFWFVFSLDSKASMVIFALLFVVQALPKVNKKNIKFHIPFLIGIIIVFVVFNTKASVNYEKALDFRLQIWEESFKIFENNPFFGNLKSSEKDLLNYNHYLSGKYYFLDSDLNSHNQYLSFLMKYGLVGVSIFFLFMINMFKKVNVKSQKSKIREFLGWTVIIVLVFYIENLLDRHHGIVYFSFMYNYYLVAVENEEI
ncbi:O-antigen ligase family protein [Meridianimaribacter flavus]|uniref:O-antigen ligase n=1 Tax=Meridianimaribacter flavus TaxID=571115 RepID=A0ABY2G725_9FLAO|nr:O-antigen ligase family protein [Meridianimaribacter flavus]TDY13596.1 O-antigen ligase [Meridianimaribacter flavus]